MAPCTSAAQSRSRPLIGPLKIIRFGVYPRAKASSNSVSETTSAQTPRSRMYDNSQGNALVLNEYDRIELGQPSARAASKRVTNVLSFGSSKTNAGVGGCCGDPWWVRSMG